MVVVCEMSHWVEHLEGGPHRSFHAAVAVGDRVFSFGGWEFSCGGKMFSGDLTPGKMDVHIFNTVSLRWRKLPPVTAGRGEALLEVPSRRCYHTAVFIGDIIYIWGGYTNTWTYSNELYAFNVETHRWYKPMISGAVPREMKGHSACVLGKVMYINGSWYDMAYDGIIPYTDTYKLDTITMVWSLINTRGTAPPVSEFHSATVIGTKIFVFGGCPNEENYSKKEGCYSNIRVFDTETDCWLSMPSARLLPEGRTDHSAFAYNGELYIFGGRTWEHVTFNDLWKFNPESFSWKKVEPKGNQPSGRYGTRCCMVGDRTVLFGGECATMAFDDLYILDLSPTLKTLCKLAVIQYGLEHSGLPHDIRWEFRIAQR